MVPIGDSMVYLRPLYVASSSNPQPQPAVRDRRAGQERRDRHVPLQRPDGRVRHVGAVDRRVVARASRRRAPAPCRAGGSGYLAAAQTEYQNALGALKAGNLAGYQSDIDAMAQQITLAQQALGKTRGPGRDGRPRPPRRRRARARPRARRPPRPRPRRRRRGRRRGWGGQQRELGDVGYHPPRRPRSAGRHHDHDPAGVRGADADEGRAGDRRRGLAAARSIAGCAAGLRAA